MKSDLKNSQSTFVFELRCRGSFDASYNNTHQKFSLAWMGVLRFVA